MQYYVILLWFLCSAKVYTLEIVVTPDELLQTLSYEQINDIFRTFTVDQPNLYQVARVLKVPTYDFFRHYLARETEERSADLLKYASEKTLHETIFAIKMVYANPDWVDVFFRSGKIEYYGDIFSVPIPLLFGSNIQWEVMEYAMATQAEKMQSFEWVTQLLGPYPTEDAALRIFEMFTIKDTTPGLMSLLGRAGEGKAVLKAYFDKLIELSYLDRMIGLVTMMEVDDNTFCSEDAQKSKKEFARNLEIPFDECHDILASNYSTRNDRFYWSLMTAIALRVWGEDKDPDLLIWVAESVPKDGLYNWQMAVVMDKCGENCKPFVNRIIGMTPPAFLPLSLMSPEICRQTWLRGSSFYVDNAPEDSDDIPNIFAIIKQEESLPLNWTLQGKPIARAIIDNVKDIMRRGKNIELSEIRQVLLSWPYLIRENEKLKFSFMFPMEETPENWHLWATGLAPQGVKSVKTLENTLDFLGICRSLTPKDVRRMIDDSYRE